MSKKYSNHLSPSPEEDNGVVYLLPEDTVFFIQENEGTFLQTVFTVSNVGAGLAVGKAMVLTTSPDGECYVGPEFDHVWDPKSNPDQDGRVYMMYSEQIGVVEYPLGDAPKFRCDV